MECLRCGQCCTKVIITLTDIKVDNDTEDFGKWLQYHRCGVGENNGFAVLDIPLTCVHLQYEPKTNRASCAIYNERPKICKDYQCLRIREES
jgi:Fe-S-cluster containining protein